MELKSNPFFTNAQIENDLIELFIKNCKNYIFTDISEIKKEKSESPDFILTNNSHLIGVEITRALNQNLQKCIKINHKYFNGKMIISTIEFEQNKQMSKEEIIYQLKETKNKNIGKAYIGNDMEDLASDTIIESIKKKQNKFQNFEKFDKNILLIHREMEPSLDIKIVALNIDNYLKVNLLQFDFLFIKLSKYFLYFNKNKFLEYIKIID